MPFHTIADEIPATGARQLAPPLQATLLAARHGLQKVARGWIAPGIAGPIANRTVRTLFQRGLLLGRAPRLRLSDTGKWYARTLARDALDAERAVS